MAILLERLEFPASPTLIEEAELCELAYRVKEPAHPKMPRTARQNLACHADGRKKTAVAAVVRLELRDAKLVSRFLRDGDTLLEHRINVKQFLKRSAMHHPIIVTHHINHRS